MVRDKGCSSRLYWRWRFSILSRTYYSFKTFLFLQWNARKTATILDDTVRALGQMNHDQKNSGVMIMSSEVRSNLINRACWEGLPNGWKWRKD